MVRMMMMMILMAWLSDQLIEQTLQNMRRTTKWFVFSERRSLFTRLHHLSGNTEEQCNMSKGWFKHRQVCTQAHIMLGVERVVSIKRQQIHFHKNEFLDDSIQTLVWTAKRNLTNLDHILCWQIIRFVRHIDRSVIRHLIYSFQSRCKAGLPPGR